MPSSLPVKERSFAGNVLPVVLRAGCKVNLYLDIGERRKDGYHNLFSLFYPLNRPFDLLYISSGRDGLSLACSRTDLSNKKNILYKAYQIFAEKSGFSPALDVYLEKGVPLGAGLGGGSSDAAVFLRWLNSVAGEAAIDEKELARLALELGADVPFFLVNKPAWVSGIGEKLLPAPAPITGLTALLVHPEYEVSTAWAYGELDRLRESGEFGLTMPSDGSYTRKFSSGAWLYNAFEAVVFRAYPCLGEIKKTLLTLGAAGVVLSGSGATIVSFYRSSLSLHKAVRYLVRSGYVYSVVQLDTGVSPSW